MNEHPALALLELFEGPLSAVSFPDTDGATLGATSLRAWASELEAAETRVREAERALEACRSDRAECDAAFRARAQRAHAYARVYAEDRLEWLAALDAIPLAKPNATSRVKKERHATKGGTISLLTDAPVRTDVVERIIGELTVDDAQSSPRLATASESGGSDSMGSGSTELEAEVGTSQTPRRGRPRKEMGEVPPQFSTSDSAPH